MLYIKKNFPRIIFPFSYKFSGEGEKVPYFIIKNRITTSHFYRILYDQQFVFFGKNFKIDFV